MKSMINPYKPMEQYHFSREDFCRAFDSVFSNDEIRDIESYCQENTFFSYFHLFYNEDEFYILNTHSGDMINWYKHIGRTNTCNNESFTYTDLVIFLRALKADIKGGLFEPYEVYGCDALALTSGIIHTAIKFLNDKPTIQKEKRDSFPFESELKEVFEAGYRYGSAGFPNSEDGFEIFCKSIVSRKGEEK